MPDPQPAVIGVTQRPSPADLGKILDLIAQAAEVDGHPAVNEAGLLALRHSEGTDSVESADLSDAVVAIATTDADKSEVLVRRPPVQVLARDQETGAVVGYAQAVWEESGPVAALVVAPDRRRQGIGSALWQALSAHTPGTLRVWASGNSPAAQALAARQGLTAVRTLLVLGRSLSGDLPPADPPAKITIRTFRPGDEDGWLGVNARAFAGHPEQGAMTRADLDQRMAEPWFDPAGLFVAVRDEDGDLVGFHWTKREPGSATGEVYVIGVDPDAGLRGLGTPLLGAGLRQLREIGCTDVDLYVEADNVRALALYHRYGFSPVSSDVMYTANG